MGEKGLSHAEWFNNAKKRFVSRSSQTSFTHLFQICTIFTKHKSISIVGNNTNFCF